MNDKYKIGKDTRVFRKATGRYDDATFIDIPLNLQENKWKQKFKNVRDALVEGTLQSSAYTPIPSNNLKQKGRCE